MHKIQNIRMISKGSCDTEDASNYVENSGINYILKYNQIYELFLIVIIFHSIDFSLLYFNQIDAAL